jgi:hypothetical protein
MEVDQYGNPIHDASKLAAIEILRKFDYELWSWEPLEILDKVGFVTKGWDAEDLLDDLTYQHTMARSDISEPMKKKCAELLQHERNKRLQQRQDQ